MNTKKGIEQSPGELLDGGKGGKARAGTFKKGG